MDERGFALVDDVGADDYRTRYWETAAARYHGSEFHRVAIARVRALQDGDSAT